MSDPEDSRNELTRRLRADKAVTTALTLQDLPSELILPIVSFLEIGGLLALRRVRFSLDKLTVTNLSGPNRLTDPYTALLRTNYSGGTYFAIFARHYHELWSPVTWVVFCAPNSRKPC